MSPQPEASELPVATAARRPLLWIVVLAALLVIAFACLAYPIYVIRPFRAQGAGELAAALAVSRFRVWITLICALFAVGALFRYWRVQPRKLQRAAFATGSFAVCAFAALCHVNLYELMFHPNTHPAFSPAARSKLDGGEKVLAVRIGPAARAYPIRSISYHHIINDVVSGAAIAATY